MNWPHRLPDAIGQMPLAEDRSAIDWGSPLTRGLVACFVPSARGNCMVDLVNGTQLVSINNARVYSGRTGRYGDCQGSGSGRGFRALTPTRLQLPLPLTIAWVGVPVGTPDAYSGLFQVLHNNADTAPYWSYGISTLSNIAVVSCNSAGGLNAFTSSLNLAGSLNRRIVLSARIASGAIRLMANGESVASSTTSLANPTYGATSTIEFGSNPAVPSRNTNARAQMGVILSGTWTVEQEAQFARNPYQILTPGARLALGVIDVTTYLLLMRGKSDLLLKGL